MSWRTQETGEGCGTKLGRRGEEGSSAQSPGLEGRAAGLGSVSASDYDVTLGQFLPFLRADVVYCKMRLQGETSFKGFPLKASGLRVQIGPLAEQIIPNKPLRGSQSTDYKSGRTVAEDFLALRWVWAGSIYLPPPLLRTRLQRQAYRIRCRFRGRRPG